MGQSLCQNVVNLGKNKNVGKKKNKGKIFLFYFFFKCYYYIYILFGLKQTKQNNKKNSRGKKKNKGFVVVVIFNRIIKRGKTIYFLYIEYIFYCTLYFNYFHCSWYNILMDGYLYIQHTYGVFRCHQ